MDMSNSGDVDVGEPEAGVQHFEQTLTRALPQGQDMHLFPRLKAHDMI
jgi:hypothetical protein